MTLVLDPPGNFGHHMPPVCPHGPTLLFYDKSTSYHYYACSASRDHQFCPFKLSAQKWKRLASSKNLIKNPERIKPDYQYLLNHPARHGYCLDCCRVLIAVVKDEQVLAKHYESEHDKCKNRIDDQQFQELVERPCRNLLTPQTRNENLAQYFFSAQTLLFIRDYLVKPFGFDKILCIGCPTVHEQLLSLSHNSFLLDLDARYHQFYEADRFARFNMFNGHFFDQHGLKSFEQFIQHNNSILILIDPPFGGLIECLARTVHRMCNRRMTEISIALFFPYFNEHWIRKAFESDQVQITDFIVTYDNHTKYGSRQSSKPSTVAQSPVRMFTNLNLANFSAIDPDQYRWCDQCSRTIFLNNRHCNRCGQCPARDSTKPIWHCVHCGRCAKITSSHCNRCNSCHLPNKHINNKIINKQ